MELWFSEHQTKNIKLSLRVKDILYNKQSKYQNISVIDTEDFGRLLALDDMVMLTTKDEFIYHEMISHIPLMTHGHALKVLVIGGGDGGTVREIIKHPIKEVHLVEIDKEVIETSKRYFPSISVGLSDPRVKIFCEDGIEFIKKNSGYDIIIVDSTDPIGPAAGLFTRDFYGQTFKALNNNGIMVAQTESPILFGDLTRKVFKDMSSVFTYTNMYFAVVPTYPGAFWSFTMGSKNIDPASKEVKTPPAVKTKYYTSELHKSYFILPPFVKDLISNTKEG